MWTNTRTHLGAAETLLRLKCIDQYICALFCGEHPAPQPPLWHLRVLQDESRHAGQTHIADMCRELESSLIALEQNAAHGPSRNDDVVPARHIKDLCEIVSKITADFTADKQSQHHPKTTHGEIDYEYDKRAV